MLPNETQGSGSGKRRGKGRDRHCGTGGGSHRLQTSMETLNVGPPFDS